MTDNIYKKKYLKYKKKYLKLKELKGGFKFFDLVAPKRINDITKKKDNIINTNSQFTPIAGTFYTKGNEYEKSFYQLKESWEKNSNIEFKVYQTENLPEFKDKKNFLKHHWTGESKKIDILLDLMNKNKNNSHIVFMDCDVLLLKPNLYKRLKTYKHYDIVCPCEILHHTVFNIGFMLIKNNKKMRKFMKNVSNIVNIKNKHDQSVINEILKKKKNIKAAFFDFEDVSVFPCLYSIFSYKKPYLIKPIRVLFNSKKTKIEINKIGISNNLTKRIIDLYT